MLSRCPCVVGEPGKGEVGPQAVEKGERAGRLRRRDPESVRHLVADVGQLGRGEVPGDLDSADIGLGEVDRGVKDIGEGHFLGGTADADRDVEIRHQEGELLDQEIPEMPGAGDCGLVGARGAQAGIGPGEAWIALTCRPDQPEAGIGEGP